jgi:hypothetical protein
MSANIQFWAMHTRDATLALVSAGYRRDCSRVVQCKKGIGYVLDIYANEAERYAADFARRKLAVLGKFDTVTEAYACLDRWAAS